MMIDRRGFLIIVGEATASLAAPMLLWAASPEVIEMSGTARGERVWFRPRGIAVAPGATIRFVNRDPGNSHTATAYHPDNYERTRRIPQAAMPWDSGFLLPDESFEVTLTLPGVYDYYCIPHEMAAMAGRIVVGTPDDPGWEGPATDTVDVSAEVLAALPGVEEILALGRVGQEDDG